MTNSEAERVRVGNHILDKLIKMLNKHGIPYVIEQPHTSYAWHDAGLKEVLRQGVPVRVRTNVRLRQCIEKHEPLNNFG